MVDDTPLQLSPPLNGPFEIDLPCDDKYHTVFLIAINGETQVVQTRAVRANVAEPDQ